MFVVFACCCCWLAVVYVLGGDCLLLCVSSVCVALFVFGVGCLCFFCDSVFVFVVLVCGLLFMVLLFMGVVCGLLIIMTVCVIVLGWFMVLFMYVFIVCCVLGLRGCSCLFVGRCLSMYGGGRFVCFYFVCFGA